jgi:predicted MFS family arabinose efflux permease
MALGVRLIPGVTGERRRIDYGGAILVALTLVALMTPLTLGGVDGWPPWTWACLGVVPLLAGAFVWAQRRLNDSGRDPMLPTELWRDGAFRIGMLLYTVTFMGVIPFFLYLGIILQTGLHITPLWQAVTTTPFAVSIAVFSLLSARLVRDLGGRRVLVYGAITAAAGFGSMILPVAAVANRFMVIWTIPSQIVAGAGLGLVIAPLLGVVLAHIRSSAAGAASGLLSTAQVIGGALGVGLMGLLFQSQLPGAAQHATATELRSGLALGLLVNPVAFAAAAFIVAARLRPPRPGPAAAPSASTSPSASTAP